MKKHRNILRKVTIGYLIVQLTFTPYFAAATILTDGATGIARDILAAYSNDYHRINLVADNADYAVLAMAAYSDPYALQFAVERGWKWRRSFEVENLGFGDTSAMLFVSERGARVLAFRGTETLGDWRTNIAGTISPFDLDNVQIEGARKIANEVSNDEDIIFVGHSLGGRMAQVAALETENLAIVFNTAPLGNNDKRKVRKNILDADTLITRFKSPEDPLSTRFSPKDIEISNVVLVEGGDLTKLANADYRHSMSSIMQAMFDVRIARDSGWIDAYREDKIDEAIDGGQVGSQYTVGEGDSYIYLGTDKGTIYKWDLTTSLEVVVETGLELRDIAFAPSGKLYAITADSLYSINLSSSKSTLIGQLLSEFKFYDQTDRFADADGFDITPKGGVGLVTSNDNHFIGKIDLATGRVTDISVFPQGGSRHNNQGIWFIDEEHYVVQHGRSLRYFKLADPELKGSIPIRNEHQYQDRFWSGAGPMVAAPIGIPDIPKGTLIVFSNNIAYPVLPGKPSLGPGLRTFNIDGIVTGATARKALNFVEIRTGKTDTVDGSLSAAITKISPNEVYAGANVIFDSSSSHDTVDEVISLLVRWDFDGDGLFDTKWVYKKIGNWTFANPGDYQVKLEVKNSLGNIATATHALNVKSNLAETSSVQGHRSAGAEPVTISGLVIGPVNHVGNVEPYQACGIRVAVENTTSRLRGPVLIYNAFDDLGNGIATAMVQGLMLPPKSNAEGVGVWLSAGRAVMKDCLKINRVELDAHSSQFP